MKKENIKKLKNLIKDLSQVSLSVFIVSNVVLTSGVPDLTYPMIIKIVLISIGSAFIYGLINYSRKHIHR